MISAKHSVLSGLKTVILFILSVAIVLLFILFYPVVKLLRNCWLNLLKSYFSSYNFSESKTIRSTVETPRNPGIIHFVLRVSGECDIDVVRAKFRDHLLDRRNADNKLIFPRFQSLLKRCFGYYVWEECGSREFDVSNNIIECPSLYRGRPVTESNVQLLLSELTSKYLAPNLPPWQIALLPLQRTQAAPCTIIMFRIHHLLLTDQPNLKISDLLLIDRQFRVEGYSEDAINYGRSPFNNVLPPSDNLTELSSRFRAGMVNCWNEWKYNLFLKRVEGGPESLWELLKCFTIIAVTVVEKFVNNAVGVESGSYVKYLWILFEKELKKNNVDSSTLGTCLANILYAFHPVDLIQSIIKVQLRVIRWVIVDIPTSCLREGKELFSWISAGCCDDCPSAIGYLIMTCPLIFRAWLEALELLVIIFNGPRVLWRQFFENSTLPHAIQDSGRCGRKIIAWSEKIPMESVVRLANKEGFDLETNQSDLLLTWLAAAISECLQNEGTFGEENQVPDSVQVSARCVYQECLLGNLKRSEGGVDGIFCFNLPLGAGNRRHLRRMRKRLKEARKENVALYSMTKNESRQGFLAEMMSPSWIRLVTNYLSRKYCVTVTDIVSKNGMHHSDGYRTLWGAEVLEFDYFRPPMANTNLSVTLQRYRDYFRLGVLADAELQPSHQIIVNAFPEMIERFNNK